MPRARARRSSRAARSPARSSPASSLTSPGSSAASSSRLSWTVSATSCCWAPSCRFRSIRCRSSSWAWTSRRRDARRSSMVACSSAVSRTLRSTKPGLRGQVGQQLVLGGGHRLVLRLLHGDRAEQLIPVTDRDRPGAHRTPAARRPPVSRAAGGGGGGSGRPDHLGRSRRRPGPRPRPATAPVAPASTAAIRSSAASASSWPGHVLREVGQHLVGRGPLPVHQPVRDPLGPLPHRLEQHRDATAAAATRQRAAARNRPASRSRPRSRRTRRSAPPTAGRT